MHVVRREHGSTTTSSSTSNELEAFTNTSSSSFEGFNRSLHNSIETIRKHQINNELNSKEKVN